MNHLAGKIIFVSLLSIVFAVGGCHKKSESKDTGPSQPSPTASPPGTAPTTTAVASAAVPRTIQPDSPVIPHYKLTILAKFVSDGRGASPLGGLVVDANDNLYGTTSEGGGHNHGTVFKIAAKTHALSTLASFDGTNGSAPNAALIVDAKGNLYGTTPSGGANGYGTVFEIAAGSHAITTLVSFGQKTGGNCPYCRLIVDAQGNLYGTTSAGGPDNHGTVFQIAAGTHKATILATFEGSIGLDPEDLVADARGNLYGTTCSCGTANPATVFRVDAATHARTTLFTFPVSNPLDDKFQIGNRLISDASGNLYGRTYDGDYPVYHGTIFKIDADTHTLTTFIDMDHAGAYYPKSQLFMDAQGNMYGTAGSDVPRDVTAKGNHDTATVFVVPAGTKSMITLATLEPSPYPVGGVVMDSGGNLYGATYKTSDGDDFARGTVFELSPIKPRL